MIATAVAQGFLPPGTPPEPGAAVTGPPAG